jgi:hypothetical protein
MNQSFDRIPFDRYFFYSKQKANNNKSKTPKINQTVWVLQPQIDVKI